LGGEFYLKEPQQAAKSLEMVEKNVIGPAKAELAIPEGVYMGAVMMNRDTFQLIDVSNRKGQNNGLVCQVPKGTWKVMAFYLKAVRVQTNRGGGAGSVDYLDAAAMDTFISLSYEKYYSHFKEYFGNVIKMFYYDEPAMHNAGGRLWTPLFNQNFEKKYGYSPMKYYPALWYDIGPETAAARNALYGFRAQLYADNLVKKLNQWCNDHGIQLTGHQDQEESYNPVPISGDLMKVFENQDTPGVDDVYWWGRSNRGYKIVSSAAANYDKPVVMGETYLAYRKIDDGIALRVAMDQYAMGVNFQVPGVSREQRPGAADLNRYVGRLSYLLQHGRHVADIAVLYPIAALQAAYYFANPLSRNRPGNMSAFDWWGLEGGLIPPEIDYIDLGETLYRGLRVDYTYIHPEVLVSRTTIDKGKLILDNKENREEFRVLIVPGGDTISAAAAKKILEFYRSGGTVIATHKLPSKSAEFNRDKEVQEMVGEVFGFPANDPVTAEVRPIIDYYKHCFANHNQAGGRSFFLPQPDMNLVSTVLKEAVPVSDVDIQQAPTWPVKIGPTYDGALTYLHKVKNGRDIYFFANSSDRPVDTNVILRGKKDLTIWNPHSGEKEQVQSEHSEMAGQPVTTVHLVLSPVSSLFYVGGD
jgi:hypothetical protein